MVALPLNNTTRSKGCSTGCGKSCGAGLEKVYPSTAVRWGAMNWIGEFKFEPGMVFSCGAKVVIQSERGIEIGQQVSLSCTGCNKHVSREQIKAYVETSGAEFFKLNSGRILREAVEQDVMEHDRLNAHNREDIDRAALLAAQLQLELKIVTVEHLLGGERIVFYFRAEDRVDFRELVRGLAHYYQTRIEMRQVRPREEARLVADYEICGRECCCKNFLKEMRPVSMKMAKLQKSTLDPAKLSGRCGRLRCCLRYEHVGYEELDRKLPRIGARVSSAHGTGVVVNRQILTQLLLIRADDEREVAVPVEEVTLLDASQAMPDAELDDGEEPLEPPRGPDRDDQRRRRRHGPRSDVPNLDCAPQAALPQGQVPGADVPPALPPQMTARPAAGGEQPQLPQSSGPAAQPDGDAGGHRRRRRRRRRKPGGPDGMSGPQQSSEGTGGIS